MSNRFKYCSAEEATIATKLVDALLAKGCTISVQDGEEWTVRQSRDRDAILDAMNSTDHDRIRARDPESEKTMGTFLLIWGNGSDLISDYTDNEFCESVADAVNGE